MTQIASKPADLAYAPRRRAGGHAPALLSFRSLRTDRWTLTHLMLAMIMGALGVIATWDVWRDIAHLFRNEPEYSHIILAPKVAIWLVFVRRMRIRHCKPVGTGLGVFIALAGWCVSAFGFYRGYQTLWHAGALGVVIGCVVAVLGKQAIFRFLPAIAVLIFVIPVPPQYRLKIAVPLQGWTAQISQALLELVNIPVERSGSLLRINGVAINIIEACNGLRMVFPLILISFAFSFTLPLRNTVRFIILLASPLSAIFCNVLRILPTVWIYGYWSKSAGDFFHEYGGYLMLPVSFLILLGVIKALRWAMVPVMRHSLAS